MKLIKYTIHKYKSIEKDQEVTVEDDITILVGMNESGKTAALESVAKTNYFQDDKKFRFNTTHDYPRREKKSMDKSGVTPKAITCEYEIDEYLLEAIEDVIGEGVLRDTKFTVTTKYNNGTTWGTLDVDFGKFISSKTVEFGISSKALNEKLLDINDYSNTLEAIIEEYNDEKKKKGLTKLKPFFENEWGWDGSILSEYIARVFLKPSLPKFLYYDEYYSLPSRISIEKLDESDLEEEQLKTAKALLELADLNPEDIVEAENFEDSIAELEATEGIISDELFKYWSSNNNLNIVFKIDAVEKTVEKTVRGYNNQEEIVDTQIVEHILDIRVKNSRTRVSLPLKNRSKGFNWFFSFLVWFKKIQEDKNSDYIILLDEPGLNLHASAQNDLLRFLEDLSDNYQIIYSTHSPFMIPSDKLSRVRTVLETIEGTKISESIQEKDPKTLFPLQAALGYDIAQNLYISTKNLLVEGVSDLIYLQTLSAILEADGRVGLSDEITIVPTGGLEKVATFISLLRGSELDIVCLLDSYTDPSGKAKLENLVKAKIIRNKQIRYYDEFIGLNLADIEDLFTQKDYIKLFNEAFTEHSDIDVKDLDDSKRILPQINIKIGKPRFNHYRPANILARKGGEKSILDNESLNNFEIMFKSINQMYS